MHYETIEEPIAVVCVFNSPGIIPKMFYWRKRTYQICQVNGHWQRREGNFLIYGFAVSDNNDNVYELEFNTANLVWRLQKIGFE